MEFGKYRGDGVIAFGITKLPYDEKETYQKAQYYYSGQRYNKGFLFHSGDYYLEIFTEDLSELDIDNFKLQDRRMSKDYIMKTYKYLYVRVVIPQ